MTRFLTVNRRIFGWGAVSYLLGEYLLKIDFTPYALIQAIYDIFFLFSPILFIIFSLISVARYRKSDELEYINKDQFPVKSFIMCLGYDLIAPIMNIIEFIKALINKESEDRGRHIARFVEMMLLIVFCGLGLLFLGFTS